MASPAKKQKTSDDQNMTKNLAAERLEVASSIQDFQFNNKRVKKLSGNDGVLKRECKGVVYWMNRDMRVQDNWAMLYAQKMALELNTPLHVVVCVADRFLEMTLRHYKFVVEGLKEVAEDCEDLKIGFHLLAGEPQYCLNEEFMKKLGIGLVVTDFSPLREHLQWVEEVKKSLPESISLHQVDAHNVVPCWEASDKQEYGARTIRPKITKQLQTYLTKFPPVIEHPVAAEVAAKKPNFEKIYKTLKVDTEGWGVEPVEWAVPGTKAGLDKVQNFVSNCLKVYESNRNDPNVDAQSNLSPWVNFGQISMQRAVLYVKKHGKSYSDGVASFVEEGIIRRELADNFCYYNKKYDKVEGAADWAQKTLADHAKDKREYVYTKEQLEQGRTHDDLWNAAQLQLIKEGKMHGFMRMYWAKKILEWTSSPQVALSSSLYLNDRYSLDGNNPNGIVGCMWSICGIHDQGWGERPIFGKIRYMNYAGCKRKFDIANYITKYGGKVFK